MPKALLRFCLTVTFISLLAGCASRPSLDNTALASKGGWVKQLTDLEDFTAWKLRGKLAYKRDTEGFSATVRWQESAYNAKIKLSNALGISLLSMEITPSLTVLEADGEKYSHSDPQQLLLERSGLDIPIAQLKRWIKALPEDTDIIELNEQGYISTLQPACLQCRRWHITYHSYAEFNGLILPSYITVRDVTQKNAFIKLKVSSWQ